VLIHALRPASPGLGNTHQKPKIVQQDRFLYINWPLTLGEQIEIRPRVTHVNAYAGVNHLHLSKQGHPLTTLPLLRADSPHTCHAHAMICCWGSVYRDRRRGWVGTGVASRSAGWIGVSDVQGGGSEVADPATTVHGRTFQETNMYLR
jgi:hypothetical protein